MRSLVGLTALAQLVAVGVVHAQPSIADAADAADAEPSTSADDDDQTQELGARVGLEAGGRTSPGGFRVAGAYLYRLTEVDWLDQSVAFGFGGGGAACFRDRQDDVLCDHGLFDGVSLDLAFGIRRYLAGAQEFSPYIRGGIGVRGVFFSADDLSGLAVPLWGGAGLKARVTPELGIVADAVLKTGFGIFNRGLGFEPQADFELMAGVEFVID